MGQFLPFIATTNYPTLLRWTGRFGPECEFPSSHVVFLDAQMDGDGRWIIPVGTLSTFVKTAQVPNCPPLRAEPYAGTYQCATCRSYRILFVLWSGHCFDNDAQSCGCAIAKGRGGG